MGSGAMMGHFPTGMFLLNDTGMWPQLWQGVCSQAKHYFPHSSPHVHNLCSHTQWDVIFWGPLGRLLSEPRNLEWGLSQCYSLFPGGASRLLNNTFVDSYNGWQWGKTEYMNRIIFNEIWYNFSSLNWYTVLLRGSLHFYIPRTLFKYPNDIHFWNISC